MIGFERLLACAARAACMLRSPFWTGAAHVVQLRPIRIEQRVGKPAPSPTRFSKAHRRQATNDVKPANYGRLNAVSMIMFPGEPNPEGAIEGDIQF